MPSSLPQRFPAEPGRASLPGAQLWPPEPTREVWSPALTVSTGETRRSMALPWYNTREGRPIQGCRGTERVVMRTQAWNTLRGRRKFEEEDEEDAADEEQRGVADGDLTSVMGRPLGMRSPWLLSCATSTRRPDFPQEGGLIMPRSCVRTTRAALAPRGSRRQRRPDVCVAAGATAGPRRR